MPFKRCPKGINIIYTKKYISDIPIKTDTRRMTTTHDAITRIWHTFFFFILLKALILSLSKSLAIIQKRDIIIIQQMRFYAMWFCTPGRKQKNSSSLANVAIFIFRWYYTYLGLSNWYYSWYACVVKFFWCNFFWNFSVTPECILLNTAFLFYMK